MSCGRSSITQSARYSMPLRRNRSMVSLVSVRPGLSHERAQDGARHRFLDPPFLDIENDPHGEFLAARQFQFGTVDLRLIGNAIGEGHGRSSFLCSWIRI